MKEKQNSFGEKLRITWFIAAKDMVDALKNKTTFSVLIGVMLMMATSQALPLLLGLQEQQRLVVVDSENQPIVETLRSSDKFDTAVVPSQQAMEEFIGEASAMWLGVVLPASLPVQGETVQLEGYLGHSTRQEDADVAVVFFEEELSAIFGGPVRIQTQGHTIYPTLNSGGRPFMIAMTLTFAVITVSAFLVPYLMIEEKETRTMEVLLVSPASIGQVVVGKAIAGMVYGVVGAAGVLLFNRAMVVHWGWVLAAVFAGALFATAIGLLMGSIFDNPQNMSLWLGALLAVLVLPVLLNLLSGDNRPEILSAIIPWFPSVLLSDLFRISFANPVTYSIALPALAGLLASAGLVLAAVTWRVRRMDQ